MKILTQSISQFFKVVISGQAYLNFCYLLASFPLGIFYFVFLISGLSTGISLLIIWFGIPILLLVVVGWWALAGFERFMAIHWLKEDIPAMALPPKEGADIWARFVEFFTNPVTWKSPLYLFLKFPLGISSFVILVTLGSLTLAFIAMPFTYQLLPELQFGVFFDPGFPTWRIDSLSDALLGTLVGLMLWPVTLHVTNGMAWLHAKFARLMLSVNPMGKFTALQNA